MEDKIVSKYVTFLKKTGHKRMDILVVHEFELMIPLHRSLAF